MKPIFPRETLRDFSLQSNLIKQLQ
jgi:hypothetical protein